MYANVSKTKSLLICTFLDSYKFVAFERSLYLFAQTEILNDFWIQRQKPESKNNFNCIYDCWGALEWHFKKFWKNKNNTTAYYQNKWRKQRISLTLSIFPSVYFSAYTFSMLPLCPFFAFAISHSLSFIPRVSLPLSLFLTFSLTNTHTLPLSPPLFLSLSLFLSYYISLSFSLLLTH